MKVVKLDSIGQCDQIKHFLDNIRKSCDKYQDNKVYLFGPVVENINIKKEFESFHNLQILKTRKEIVQKVNKITPDSVVIYSPQGYFLDIDTKLKEKKIKIIDESCKEFKKLIRLINKALKNKRQVFYIGTNDSFEKDIVLNISNKIKFIDYRELNVDMKVNDNAVVFNQPTLNEFYINRVYGKLRAINPNIELASQICPRIIERQNNILSSQNCDFTIIIGENDTNETNLYLELSRLLNPDSKRLVFENLDDVTKFEKENGFSRDKKYALTSTLSIDENELEEIYRYLKKLK